MKIAIIGSGISGLVSAHLLCRRHEITLFEAGEHVGGHTNTIRLQRPDGDRAVDTGFIVYNEANYPGFTRLLEILGVETQPAPMSFSVSSERSGLEYSGTNLNGLFAQRRNLLRPSFLGMIRDILRFYREAPTLLDAVSAGGADDRTLGEYLEGEGYGHRFIEEHILPMAAAVWSAGVTNIREAPVREFVSFFRNHGFLQLEDAPAWRAIRGGSFRYVEAITRPFRDRIRLGTPVLGLRRETDGVSIRVPGEGRLRFDAAVVAVHSDQALRLLEDPSPLEREILAAIRYQENDTVLHTDERLLPRSRRAWASWNYHLPAEPVERPTVTYHMNHLQTLTAPEEFCVTLNRGDRIDPERVIRRMIYEHPFFDGAAVRARGRHGEINGRRRTFYCGAYWGFGFHEDGVQSALAVGKHFGEDLDGWTAPSTSDGFAIAGSSR